MDPDGAIRLVSTILRGTPSLPLAACRGQDPRIFDPDRSDGETTPAPTQRREFAREICGECPERHRCPTCGTAYPIAGSVQVRGLMTMTPTVVGKSDTSTPCS